MHDSGLMHMQMHMQKILCESEVNISGRKIPILFLANKMDLPDSLTTVKLVAGLGLERIQNKPWHIRATNALTGEGLQPAIEWLTDQIRDIYINKR